MIQKSNVNRIGRLSIKLPLDSLPTPVGVYIFFFLARPLATVFTFFLLYKGSQAVRFSSYNCPTLYSINVAEIKKAFLVVAV